jgi:OOP family OmpA-OmpF porin
MKSMTVLMLVAAAGACSAVGEAPAQDRRAYGGAYAAVAAVGQDQAQVVYYRAEEGSGAAVANVYLDREFITALKPGGYTAFCVAPGRHMLGSYLDDAPTYSGKNDELYAATFKGGSTYYLKVREEGGNHPMPVTRAVASTELTGQRQQIHLLSRASKVEPCRHYGYLDAPTLALREYVLLADTSFSGRGGMSAAGNSQISSLLAELQRENAEITRVEVEGHTDPLGTVVDNQMLGQRWADTVRSALVSSGLPQSMMQSSSAGSRTLVKHGCYGTLEQQRACYAPNRRVVLRVEVRMKPAP